MCLKKTRCSLVWLKAPALGAGDREFESHLRDQDFYELQNFTMWR